MLCQCSNETTANGYGGKSKNKKKKKNKNANKGDIQEKGNILKPEKMSKGIRKDQNNILEQTDNLIGGRPRLQPERNTASAGLKSLDFNNDGGHS